jgi:16S rRNA (guanine527-N7)-methyltransferase
MELARLIRADLDHGARELGLTLTDKMLDQLLNYLQLLIKWNKVYSLTAITDINKMLTHHLLDGLTVINLVNSFKNILDVGSGMGVPGIIIAICLPKTTVTVIDCNAKKTSFLQQVVIELALKNIKVVNSRIEDFVPEQKFDLAISRAFAKSLVFLNLVQHVFSGKINAVLMKSNHVYLEMLELEKLAKYNCELLPVAIPRILDKRYLLKIEEK